METSLTTHYLTIETERARLPVQAARGHLVGEATATRPKPTGSLAERRRVGVVLSAMVARRPFAIGRLLTHVHSARQSAHG